MSTPENLSTLKDFPVWESKLAGRFGVGRDRLLALRLACLRPGIDWVKKGRRVCLSLEAVGKLEGELGLSSAESAGAVITAPPEPLPKQVFVFKVYGKKVTHPHLVLATDGQRIFRVRVKTKINFIAGMPIKCEHDQADMFNHVGNCPRFRGRY